MEEPRPPVKVALWAQRPKEHRVGLDALAPDCVAAVLEHLGPLRRRSPVLLVCKAWRRTALAVPAWPQRSTLGLKAAADEFLSAPDAFVQSLVTWRARAQYLRVLKVEVDERSTARQARLLPGLVEVLAPRLQELSIGTVTSPVVLDALTGAFAGMTSLEVFELSLSDCLRIAPMPRLSLSDSVRIEEPLRPEGMFAFHVGPPTPLLAQPSLADLLRGVGCCSSLRSLRISVAASPLSCPTLQAPTWWQRKPACFPSWRDLGLDVLQETLEELRLEGEATCFGASGVADTLAAALALHLSCDSGGAWPRLACLSVQTARLAIVPWPGSPLSMHELVALPPIRRGLPSLEGLGRLQQLTLRQAGDIDREGLHWLGEQPARLPLPGMRWLPASLRHLALDVSLPLWQHAKGAPERSPLNLGGADASLETLFLRVQQDGFPALPPLPQLHALALESDAPQGVTSADAAWLAAQPRLCFLLLTHCFSSWMGGAATNRVLHVRGSSASVEDLLEGSQLTIAFVNMSDVSACTLLDSRGRDLTPKLSRQRRVHILCFERERRPDLAPHYDPAWLVPDLARSERVWEGAAALGFGAYFQLEYDPDDDEVEEFLD